MVYFTCIRTYMHWVCVRKRAHDNYIAKLVLFVVTLYNIAINSLYSDTTVQLCCSYAKSIQSRVSIGYSSD